MNMLGKAFAGIGVLCLALALTAGVIAGICFDAADMHDGGQHG